jgi:hypothetical protein
MKFAAKRDPLLHSWIFFRGKFHSKSLYSVEKTIVGISQYAYFSCCENLLLQELAVARTRCCENSLLRELAF